MSIHNQYHFWYDLYISYICKQFPEYHVQFLLSLPSEEGLLDDNGEEEEADQSDSRSNSSASESVLFVSYMPFFISLSTYNS